MKSKMSFFDKPTYRPEYQNLHSQLAKEITLAGYTRNTCLFLQTGIQFLDVSLPCWYAPKLSVKAIFNDLKLSCSNSFYFSSPFIWKAAEEIKLKHSNDLYLQHILLKCLSMIDQQVVKDFIDPEVGKVWDMLEKQNLLSERNRCSN